MTATYITAAICIWAIAAMFAYAFIRGATSIPSSREVRRAEALEEV
jgi:hypothetical protein